jgi:GNAT superfamily N-acetyltransferase
MKPLIVVPTEPTSDDRAAIYRELRAFNFVAATAPNYKLLSILIHDPKTDKTIGGLWGKTDWDWLFIEALVVPDNMRRHGLGSQIMRQAETIAVQRGCSHAWLETFSFQAPDFYLKQGYTVFGKLDDYPKGSTRIFFRKNLS